MAYWGLFLCTIFVASLHIGFAVSQYNYKDDDSESESCPPPFDVPHANVNHLTSNVAQVRCKPGYILQGSSKLYCSHAVWYSDSSPKCLKLAPLSDCLMNALFRARMKVGDSKYSLEVFCDDGYEFKLPKESVSLLKAVCIDATWRTMNFPEVLLPNCSRSASCGPPSMPGLQLLEQAAFDSYPEGSYVSLMCSSDLQFYRSQCLNGQWTEVACEGCIRPQKSTSTYYKIEKIPNIHSRMDLTLYPLGTVLEYVCTSARSSGRIECQQDGKWSEDPSKLCTHISQGCSSLPHISHASCFCDPVLPRRCPSMIDFGSQVKCFCEQGFDLVGEEVLTCKGADDWSSYPTCISSTGKTTSDKNSLEENNSSHIAPMNPLGIAIATACSVLGVLVLVMVIMVIRRVKSRGRLYRPVGTPPPFPHPPPSFDEHDRVALIGYDAARLPTYEEATSQSRSSTRNFDVSDTRSLGSRSVGSSYRPLPSIPSGFRHQNLSNCETISSRHSINTTSTVNRDGISEVFGSIDTVNVSVSDASTSVTLDTLDSGASRRTNTSGRATAGSLESSRENVSTEDAPLIDNQNETETRDIIAEDVSEEDVKDA